MNELQSLAAKILPANNGLVFTGEAKELNSATSGVVQTFVFALLVVLLVLAGQFESFASAFILIATVPFGLAAAVFAILLTHGSINIYSEIGLVMLVGLMSKNGILIVEFANQLRDAGQSVHDAVRNAALIRLRPGGDDHDRHRARRPASGACAAAPAPRPAMRSAGSSSAASASPRSPRCS